MTKTKVAETILRAVGAIVTAAIAILKFIGYANKAQEQMSQIE